MNFSEIMQICFHQIINFAFTMNSLWNWHTADGSEIQLTSWGLSSLSAYQLIPLFTGFKNIPGGFLARFLNHEQYSGYSWMYPYQHYTPMGNPYISPKKSRYLWIIIPKNPIREHQRNGENSQIMAHLRHLRPSQLQNLAPSRWGEGIGVILVEVEPFNKKNMLSW